MLTRQNLLRPFALLLLTLTLVACSNSMAVVGIGADSQKENVAGVTKHKIFYATTRARDENDRVYYGGRRYRGLQNGTITVAVPPEHVTGKIEVAESADQFDPKRHFSVAEPLVFDGTSAFINRLNKEIASRPPHERSVLVFVHGYNTSFSMAVTRLTQFVHDTGFTGVPVLFTWASRARTAEYAYDMNSALQSRFHMAELAIAMQSLHVDEYNILAHSMGNLATLETLVVLNSMEEFDTHGKLKAIILAAPDVDVDLFKEHMVALRRVRDKIYVLISEDDKALAASKLLAGGVSRAGAANPERLAQMGITVVDLTKIEDRSRADHSKFADSPAIVQLIGRGINDGNSLSSQSHGSTIRTSVGNVVQSFNPFGGGGGILTLGN